MCFPGISLLLNHMISSINRPNVTWQCEQQIDMRRNSSKKRPRYLQCKQICLCTFGEIKIQWVNQSQNIMIYMVTWKLYIINHFAWKSNKEKKRSEKIRNKIERDCVIVKSDYSIPVNLAKELFHDSLWCSHKNISFMNKSAIS